MHPRSRETPIDERERELIEEIYPSLRRFGSAVRGAHDDGNDLVQDALVRVLRRGRLTDLEYPVAYLRRTIINLAVDRSRARERQQRAYARIGPGKPAEDVHSWDLDELREVSPKSRAVLFLNIIEGRPFPEIAEILGCSQVSARVAATRGRRQLEGIFTREVRDASA